MSDHARLLLLIVAAAAFAVSLWRYVAANRSRAARRAGLLDECKALFSGGIKAIAVTGLPRLTGTYQGHDFDLQLVPDTLNFRKLPALWLLVTLPEPMPVAATFDLMMRPRGVEPFSKFAERPIQIDIPPGFPADCAIRCDARHGLAEEATVRRHLDLFADDQMKELVISPKGLRLTRLAEEAERSNYLFFRNAEFDRPVDPAPVRVMLDRLLELRSDLQQTGTQTS